MHRRVVENDPAYFFAIERRIVHDIPDVVVFQPGFERSHVQIRRNPFLDVEEDLTVGAAVLPLGIGEIRRRRADVVARSAGRVHAVARRARLRKERLPGGD